MMNSLCIDDDDDDDDAHAFLPRLELISVASPDFD
jgi:hypothetical protein